jgi:cold shock CspA family protein
LEITFRGVTRTDSLEKLIYDEASSLEKVCDYMISGSIAVEKPHRHPRSGNPYRVRIGIRIPHNPELVVTRESGEGEMHDSLAKVLRSAFKSMRRQLKKLVEKQRYETKIHPDQQAAAVVQKLFPIEGYGFLKTIEGREIYFHKNSVLHGDFERLEIGTGVRYVEEAGREGPQASTVQIEDKPGSRMIRKS